MLLVVAMVALARQSSSNQRTTNPIAFQLPTLISFDVLNLHEKPCVLVVSVTCPHPTAWCTDRLVPNTVKEIEINPR